MALGQKKKWTRKRTKIKPWGTNQFFFSCDGHGEDGKMKEEGVDQMILEQAREEGQKMVKKNRPLRSLPPGGAWLLHFFTFQTPPRA